MTSILSAAANIFFSLLFGAIALAVCAVQWPEMFDGLLIFAEGLRQNLTNLGIPVQYNVWVKFLIQDQQLVFMFFVILMRVIFAVLLWGVASVMPERNKQTAT